MKGKKLRNAAIVCGFISVLLIIDIVILFTDGHKAIYKLLIRIGILLSLLRWVHTYLLLSQETENETEEKKKLLRLLDMGYYTSIVIVFTPAMVMSCLDPELPLPIKVLSIFATVYAIWILVSGLAKYFGKIR